VKTSIASPELIPLAVPRSLTSGERMLVDFLLAGPCGSEELRVQAETAEVVRRCSCGCASIGLRVDPSAPRSATDGWVPISARRQTSIADRTEVTLHVIDGRLERLEVWGGRSGLRPEIDPSRLEYASVPVC
jgi:hypothetical protein